MKKHCITFWDRTIGLRFLRLDGELDAGHEWTTAPEWATQWYSYKEALNAFNDFNEQGIFDWADPDSLVIGIVPLRELKRQMKELARRRVEKADTAPGIDEPSPAMRARALDRMNDKLLKGGVK